MNLKNDFTCRIPIPRNSKTSLDNGKAAINCTSVRFRNIHHYCDFEHSTYLMINNKNKSVDEIKDKAVIMFNEIFPELQD